MHDNPQYDEYKERLTNFSHEFDPGLFMLIVRKSAGYVFAMLFIAVLSAFLYLRYTPEVYEATTVMQLGEDDSGGKILNVNRMGVEQSSLEAKVELLRSKLLVKRTLERMNLEVSYYAKGRILTNEHYVISPYRVEVIEVFDESVMNAPIFVEFFEEGRFTITYFSGQYEGFTNGAPVTTPEFSFKLTVHNPEMMAGWKGDTELFFKLNTLSKLIPRFSGGLDIRVLNNTAKTIELSFKDNNPFLARDFIATLADEFLRFDLEKRQRSDENILAFIDAQIDTVYERLRGSEGLLNEYKQSNKITDLSNLSSVYLDRLTDLENKIIQLELEERMLSDVGKFTSLETEAIALNNLVPLVAGSVYESALAGQLSNLELLLAEREQQLFKVTPNNVSIRTIEYQIGIQKEVVLETISALLSKVIQRKDDLYAKLSEIEAVYYGLPTKELEFARLERIFTINEKYYTLLLEKRIEYRISKEGFVSQNQILEEARLPTLPVSPKEKAIVVSFVIAGFLLSFVFISVRYLLNNSITTLNEVVRLSNASISTLGVVPKYKENIPTSMLLVDKSPKSVMAESFRTIRTNLQFIDNSEGSKVVAITSTISGEGKTFIALNLAGIIAFSGKKVIVLDLDMRRPRIHKGMGVANDRGMSTLLINKAKLEDCILPTSLPTLHFIPAGPIPPNPSELILSGRMAELLTRLKEDYDLIVIDTPPVGLVTDGISIIAKADYPLYVFRADYSKKRFVQNVDRLMNENRISRLSVVLNGVDLERNKYSYSYGYGYGYGYSYQYGSNGYYDDRPAKKGWLKQLFQR
jgi:capsular exopolysaccharide synthesis family protein